MSWLKTKCCKMDICIYTKGQISVMNFLERAWTLNNGDQSGDLNGSVWIKFCFYFYINLQPGRAPSQFSKANVNVDGGFLKITSKQDPDFSYSKLVTIVSFLCPVYIFVSLDRWWLSSWPGGYLLSPSPRTGELWLLQLDHWLCGVQKNPHLWICWGSSMSNPWAFSQVSTIGPL